MITNFCYLLRSLFSRRPALRGPLTLLPLLAYALSDAHLPEFDAAAALARLPLLPLGDGGDEVAVLRVKGSRGRLLVASRAAMLAQ